MKNMPQYPRPQTLIDCMIVIWKLFKIMKLCKEIGTLRKPWRRYRFIRTNQRILSLTRMQCSMLDVSLKRYVEPTEGLFLEQNKYKLSLGET